MVGCGFVAKKRHIPAFLRLKKNVDLCAVCDLNEEVAGAVAKEFRIPHVYSDVSEMLSKEGLDVVDVCTPPQVHAPIAVEAMESGCHVLLEKPMALKVSDCDDMIRASEKHGSKISVVHNQLFYPPFMKARELVHRDAIGKLTGMSVLSLTHRKEFMPLKDHWIHRLPGGTVGETGPHSIYMSLAFLKNVKDVSVYASKSLEYPWVLYDDYRIELVGENMTSSIIISHANDYTASKVELFGTEASIKMDLQSMLLIKYTRENLTPMSVALSSLNTAGQMTKGILKNALRMMINRPMLGHDIMIEKFVASILKDQQVPVPPEEGRETVKLMEMIVKSLSKKYDD
ncbi:MAG: Gfo/Idh/MocA family protein [Candidatus Odinarchaeia archaeon]